MMLQRMRSMLRRPRGATAVEYMIVTLIAVVIAMIVVVVLKVFGGNIEEKIVDANDEFSGTLASDAEERRRSKTRSGGELAVREARVSDGVSGRERGDASDGLDEVKGPGMNPVTLLLAICLVGLLVYVVVKGKNEPEF